MAGSLVGIAGGMKQAGTLGGMGWTREFLGSGVDVGETGNAGVLSPRQRASSNFLDFGADKREYLRKQRVDVFGTEKE